MKKTVFAIIAILVVVIAGALFYLFSNLDALVKMAIEEYGSEATQTSVQVEEVAIRLDEGAAAINGLTIANPDGFTLPQAFSLGGIEVDINLEKTTKELVAIDAISISAPRVFYEVNADREGSLNILTDNLAAGEGASAAEVPAGGEPATGSDSAQFKLNIARFEFNEASLHAKIVPLNDKTYDLKVPAFVLTNLDGTPEQIFRQVLDTLIEHAKQEIRKQGLDKELADTKAEAQQRIDEERAKLEQKTDDQLDEEMQKAEDKLKNLFGR